MEQSPEDNTHAACVGKVVRCLHLVRENADFPQTHVIEGKYGTAKRGGYVIVRDEADTEAKVVTIKDGDVKWDPEALAALKLPLETIQNRYSSM